MFAKKERKKSERKRLETTNKNTEQNLFLAFLKTAPNASDWKLELTEIGWIEKALK